MTEADVKSAVLDLAPDVPFDKPPDEYSCIERRAELYTMIEDAGHPRNLEVSQDDLADKYDVSQPMISKDFRALWDFDDLPRDDVDRPGRGFDLSEQQANDIVRELSDMEGVYAISRSVGGTQSGRTDNAWSVNFALRLSTGHLVRAEIHSDETWNGPSIDTFEQSDDTMDALRDIAGVHPD